MTQLEEPSHHGGGPFAGWDTGQTSGTLAAVPGMESGPVPLRGVPPGDIMTRTDAATGEQAGVAEEQVGVAEGGDESRHSDVAAAIAGGGVGTLWSPQRLPDAEEGALASHAHAAPQQEFLPHRSTEGGTEQAGLGTAAEAGPSILATAAEVAEIRPSSPQVTATHCGEAVARLLLAVHPSNLSALLALPPSELEQRYSEGLREALRQYTGGDWSSLQGARLPSIHLVDALRRNSMGEAASRSPGVGGVEPESEGGGEAEGDGGIAGSSRRAAASGPIASGAEVAAATRPAWPPVIQPTAAREDAATAQQGGSKPLTCIGHWIVTPSLACIFDISLAPGEPPPGEDSPVAGCPEDWYRLVLPGSLQLAAFAVLRQHAAECAVALMRQQGGAVTAVTGASSGIGSHSCDVSNGSSPDGDRLLDGLLCTVDAFEATAGHRACRYGDAVVVGCIFGITTPVIAPHVLPTVLPVPPAFRPSRRLLLADTLHGMLALHSATRNGHLDAGRVYIKAIIRELGDNR